MTHITCRLTAKNRGQLRNPTLGDRVWASFHWRQPRRGCRGHIPQYFGWGTSTGISPILLRTFGYSTPILVALRSLSLKPISFGYKTPPIRFSQAGGQSAHKARPPNLQLALTPLLALLLPERQRYSSVHESGAVCVQVST